LAKVWLALDIGVQMAAKITYDMKNLMHLKSYEETGKVRCDMEQLKANREKVFCVYSHVPFTLFNNLITLDEWWEKIQ
jgi:hypothetical protein